jgi:hypothetical protein
MTLYALRYRHDTDLGRKFTQITLHTYDDEKTAERVRDMCANAASIEVVEVDANGKIGAQVKTAPAARQRCDSGASPTGLESTDG